MRVLLRFLCFAVDFVVVMFALQIVLFGFMDLSPDAGLAPLVFFIAAFAVYNILFVYYMGGQTPGKAVGRLFVKDIERDGLEKPDMSQLFLRESLKAIYFVPVIGQLIGLASAVLVMFGKSSLHDYVGRTAVLFLRKD